MRGIKDIIVFIEGSRKSDRILNSFQKIDYATVNAIQVVIYVSVLLYQQQRNITDRIDDAANLVRYTTGGTLSPSRVQLASDIAGNEEDGIWLVKGSPSFGAMG